MPRVLHSKHRPRFCPAGSSASNAIRRPFKYNAHRKQTNFQRLLVALHTIRPTGLTAVQDIFEKISSQAEDNGEVLGRRWNQFVHVALSVLRKNGYLEIQVQEDDEEEYCRLTEDGIQIMTDADAWFGDLRNQRLSFEKCRRAGQYIQWRISPSPIRPLTRRELDVENRELERQQQEHIKVCPILLGWEPHPTYPTPQNKIPHDLMDVDEVPVAGSSTTRTPIRHSASLHNPAAYPTPQSLPRARNSPRPASISPPQTPMTRSHSPSILEEGQSSDNDEADNSVSYEGEMALVIETCRNMDWQNIGHVTAISQALQERNDVLEREKEDLQLKMEFLEREKEEQVDQLNRMVEHLEIEKRNLQSQFWLFRWRYASGMTALQNALDSAISERDRYIHQVSRLQGRLNDIERRKALMRRLEDAESVDDELLKVIDQHLK